MLIFILLNKEFFQKSFNAYQIGHINGHNEPIGVPYIRDGLLVFKINIITNNKKCLSIFTDGG